MAPYPTTEEVKAIMELEYSNETEKREEYLSHVADNFNGIILSGGSSFEAVIDGKDHYRQRLAQRDSAIHQSHQLRSEVVLAVGGGESEWAAIELVERGKTNHGKSYNCEWTLFVKFNTDKKIEQARFYIDSNALSTLAVSGGYDPADALKA